MKNINIQFKIAATLVAAFFFRPTLAQLETNKTYKTMNKASLTQPKNNDLDTATFGAGCFWCVEAVFKRLKGVVQVKSGYTGGNIKNPTYKEVCSGLTGHAEACELVYDKTQVTFDELLEVFWKTHDPTTVNQQGNDHGTQYRSAVFYHNDEQKLKAEQYKKQLNDAHVYPSPIVTEISPASIFYEAENYHQDYFNANGSQPYCKFVIQPKVEKFEKIFKDKVKH
jgi:peptide-methionine (S)-S-oxide reductase